MRRDTESSFLDNLEVSKRGIVKTAASQLPNGKEIVTYSNVMQDIEKVLRAFDKSPEITHATIDIYKKRASLGDNPKSVAQDFFKELVAQRAKQTQMSLMTAMAYRQVGIFKVAGRDVYEDLETGDFWKISEDKKHVMRLFKEDEKGVADKKASKEVEAKEFADSSEFTTAFEKAEKHVDELKRAIDTEKWLTYLKEGDKTEYVTLFEKFMAGIDSFFELSKSMGFKITSTLEADVKLEGNSVKELLKKIKDNDQINDALDKDEDDIDEEYEGEYYVHLVLKTKENYTKEKLEEEIKDLHYDEDEFNLTHTFYDFEGIQKFRKIPDGYEFVVSWVTAK